LSVKLRLTRMGRKKRPFYRIVATDSRARRDGKYLEKIGTYNPLTHPAEVDINKELALKWLEQGAQPSTTVRNFLSKQGIMFELDLRKRGLSEEEIALEYKKWEAIQAERQKKDEAVAAMKKRDTEKLAEEEAKAKAKEEAAQAAKEAAEAAAAAESEEVTEEVAPESAVSEEASAEESTPDEEEKPAE
jgi:small subunit ribosomal protein S16